MLRVEYAHWGQSPEDLRRLAMSAPHARPRERALALYEIAQGSCATRVAARTGRHPQTVMGWVHAYNAQGPDTLAFRRTGGRPPLCAQIAAALRDAVCAAQRTAATPPREGADPAPRWTLKRLGLSVRERFGRRCCRETIRTALHRLTLSWKQAVVEASCRGSKLSWKQAVVEANCRGSKLWLKKDVVKEDVRGDKRLA